MQFMKTKRTFWLAVFIQTGFVLTALYSCSDDDIINGDLPLISTTEVTDIQSTTATSGGNITDDGGLPVTQRGVVWSTEADPDIENNDGITSDGTGIGSFTSNITDLSPGTFYYLKAYATNDNGTGYGNQQTFTTLGQAPTVLTQQATEITPESAVLTALVNPSHLETTVIFEWGLTDEYGNEKTAEQSPIDGSTNVSVNAFIDGLEPITLYHFRVVAENEFGLVYGNATTFTTYGVDDPQDIDGNYFRTVIIGEHEWMAENLRVTKYQNGDAIQGDLGEDDWQNTTSGAYANYPYGDVAGIYSDKEMVEAYGKLYNWHAVDDPRGLCPEGWHVPSDDEWTILGAYLGGYYVAGGELKSTRMEPDPHPRWNSPTVGATNESGFTGLPASQRMYHGGYWHVPPGGHASFWSSTEEEPGSEFAWSRFLVYYSSELQPYIGSRKGSGRSVRCFREVGN